MTNFTKLILVLALALPLLAAGKVTYAYDSNGHLGSITYPDGRTITYSYDLAGNLLKRVIAGGAASAITGVNTAGAGPEISQNAWIEIKGTNIVPADTPPAGVIWSTAPEFALGKMPTKIGSVSVTVNGKAAYVYYYCSAVTSTICASDQVNVLAPLDDTLGPATIVVTSGASSTAPFTVNKKAASPSFLLFSPPYVVATHLDNNLLGPSSLYPGATTPAKAEELVVLYAVGFGLPLTQLIDGSSSQSGVLTPTPVCKVGDNPAAVAFAGLIAPGLYQLNVTIPKGTGDADQPISCTYGGASTPPGDQIAVHQ